jgi:hypothetical protein
VKEAAMPVPPVPRPPDDDELGDLPPLDGDEREAPPADPDAEGEDLESGEASLDDSTGEDDAVETDDLEVDEAETGWLDEPPDAPGLDLGDAGTLELGADGDSGDDADDRPPPPEDYGFGDAPEKVGLDSGDEGPVDPDEELRDEDLPALDADEAGDVDEASLVDPSFAADEPQGLPWAARPWERVGAPLPLVHATAIVCSSRGATVVGRGEGAAEELWHVDLEGSARSQPLSPESAPVSEPSAPTRPAPTDAIDPAVRAARHGFEAYAARVGGVLRSGPAGGWTAHPWPGQVTALVFLDDAGRLLAAAYSRADDTTALVALDAAGVATVVARVGATRADPDSDGQVAAMAHDEARGVVWVAGGFGVAAFAVS